MSLLDVAVVGENGMNADIVVTPWPSDHRAVVATFAVPEPGAPTMLLAGSTLLTALGRLRARS